MNIRACVQHHEYCDGFGMGTSAIDTHYLLVSLLEPLQSHAVLVRHLHITRPAHAVRRAPRGRPEAPAQLRAVALASPGRHAPAEHLRLGHGHQRRGLVALHEARALHVADGLQLHLELGHGLPPSLQLLRSVLGLKQSKIKQMTLSESIQCT